MYDIRIRWLFFSCWVFVIWDLISWKYARLKAFLLINLLLRVLDHLAIKIYYKLRSFILLLLQTMCNETMGIEMFLWSIIVQRWRCKWRIYNYKMILKAFFTFDKYNVKRRGSSLNERSIEIKRPLSFTHLFLHL